MRLGGICAFLLAILVGLASVAADDYTRPVSIKVIDAPGNAGLVFPGDRVGVRLTSGSQSEFLMQNVTALVIDQTGGTATLEVNSVEAQELVRAQTDGDLSLVLRSSGYTANPPVRCAGLTASDLCLYQSPVVASQP